MSKADLKDVFEIAEKYDIHTSYEGSRGGLESYTGLSYYTGIGEECLADIWGDNPTEFAKNLKNYIENFDPEEFERPWIQMTRGERAKRGAPENIEELLASAREFCSTLEDFCEQVEIYCKTGTAPVLSNSKKIHMVDYGGNPHNFRNLTIGGNVTNRYWIRKSKRDPNFKKDRETAAKKVVPRYLTPSQAGRFNTINRKHPGSIDRAGYDCPRGTKSNVRFITVEELRKTQLKNLAKGREIRKKNLEAKKKAAGKTVSASKKKPAEKVSKKAPVVKKKGAKR